VISLVEDVLAAWRLVRLARTDTITQPLRDRLYDVLDEDAVPSGVEPDVDSCECGHPSESHEDRFGPCCAALVRLGSESVRSCVCEQYRPRASARAARMRHPKLATLVECPYCLSIYAAGLVLVLRRLRCGWLVRLLAVSALAGEVAAEIDR
jgi:hypothetical protein